MKYYYNYTYNAEGYLGQKCCLEECPFKQHNYKYKDIPIFIGSCYCVGVCGLCNDYNIDESWVDCDKLLVEIRKRKLKSIKL
jgi:hypothetical protein